MLHTFYIILYFFYISLLELSGGINRALHQSALTECPFLRIRIWTISALKNFTFFLLHFLFPSWKFHVKSFTFLFLVCRSSICRNTCRWVRRVYVWSHSTDICIVCLVLPSGSQISVYQFQIIFFSAFHSGCTLGTILATCINWGKKR